MCDKNKMEVKGLLGKLTESTREAFLEMHADYQRNLANSRLPFKQLRKQWRKED